MSLIYLDFNRTTPVAPSVIESMQAFWSTHFMLPSQSHVHASAVSEAVENAREGVSMLLGCDPFEVVFTSGGTEANNLGVLGAAMVCRSGGLPSDLISHYPCNGDGPTPHALVSEVEDESVIAASRQLRLLGWEVETVPCNEYGIVSPEAFESRFRETTHLACLQLANPVLGTIQPIRKLADLCHNRGIRVHCDATAAVGRIPIDVNILRVDTLSLTAHKIYGPKGAGALFVRRGLDLHPISYGESREMGLRAGSENVPGIVGLGAAASLTARCVDEAQATLNELCERLIDGLRSTLDGRVTVLSEHHDRLPNTICIEMGCEARRLQKAARQIVVASAQSISPPDEMTRTLRAIGRTEKQIGRTLRFSVGWTTSREQIDKVVNLLAEASEVILS
ncbi:cysteine desulfurase [Neorhodopirellula lusitana]|uniref:Cysteine desulfurase n=1 Tax=Neorhodopirellula lusitana TaxID=445327 RepID=A0ABY1QC07_9BACT|nr:cysteine desulfurase family protein [Neorhodopirellula lusitana]SMP65194.1 cysteine desulfurase [Neorhodopirellula lusitana]